jgi:hypothetical protein
MVKMSMLRAQHDPSASREYIELEQRFIGVASGHCRQRQWFFFFSYYLSNRKSNTKCKFSAFYHS